MAALTSGGRPCFAGDDYLARAVGCSSKTVANELTVLCSGGRRRKGVPGIILLRRTSDGASRRLEIVPFPYVGNGYPTYGKYKREEEKKGKPHLRCGVPGSPPGREDKTPPRAGNPAPPADGNGVNPEPTASGMEPLVNVPPSPRDRVSRANPADKVIADQIIAFARQRKWTPPTARRYCAGAIAGLRRRLAAEGSPPADVERVWEWYAANYGHRPKLPRVRSGRELADRWQWIVDRMNAPAPFNADVEISPGVREMVPRLTNVPWPAGAEAAVPAFAQACLNNITAFLAVLRQIAKRYRNAKPPPGLLDVIEHVRSQMPPYHYAEQWVESVHGTVRRLNKWRGDFAPFVWRADDPQFRKTLESWAAEWGGPRAAAALLAELERGDE